MVSINIYAGGNAKGQGSIFFLIGGGTWNVYTRKRGFEGECELFLFDMWTICENMWKSSIPPSSSRWTLAKATDQHHERCTAHYSPLRGSFRAFSLQGEVLLDGLILPCKDLPSCGYSRSAYHSLRLVCATDHVFVLYQWKLFGATVSLGTCLRQTLKRSFLTPSALDSRFALAALSINNTKPSLWQRLIKTWPHLIPCNLGLISHIMPRSSSVSPPPHYEQSLVTLL